MNNTIGALLFTVACGAVIAGHPQQPPPATIRTGVTSVPIDVRVVDRNDKPVTDLKQEDFTILEESVPQQIRHFATQAFTADPAAALTEPRFRTAASAAATAPENRRVFLILIGRGRHQSASKYVDALARFLADRVLPQDQVALFAWNRATDFTTNREILVRTLARYLEEYERIETDLRERFSGLRAVYGAKDIPPHVQQRIDSVFEEARAIRARPLAPGATASLRKIDETNRRNLDHVLSSATERMAGARPEQTAEALNATFDQYAATVTETMQDIANLYTGIDYLRHLDGEKHLLMLTEKGVTVPRSDRGVYVNLARAASDARIALDIVHTGGTDAGLKQPMAQGFAVGDLRVMADLTGGQMAAFRKGDDAFRRLEDASSFQYLLAYYPSDAVRDGKYRKVTVKVNRPDVRVMHRQGYFATDRLVPMDRREFVTASRIEAASQYGRPIDHLKVAVSDTAVAGAGTDRALTVRVTVDASKLKFTTADGRHLGRIDVALFCGDEKDRVVGEARQHVNLTLTDEQLQRVMKEGVTFPARVPLTAAPSALKVIVYDYGADLVGSSMTKLR
jgi:VWFA-related protein